jgi:4-amino-4-deoxy-L-arabinose transferase-like glycosyltransferase
MFDIYKIIGWIKKNITLRDWILIVLLLVVYFLTRVYNLTNNYPIFTDEGIYIHWSKIAWHDASWRFISLTDGRQPLQTWATIPFLKIFAKDLLFGGRMFGVFSGLFSMAGIFSLSYYLFNKKTAFLASFIYIFTPFLLFFDRLAMIDSFVAASFTWVLLISFILSKRRDIGTAVIYGLVAGLFLLAKSTVVMFICLTLLSVVFILNKKDSIGENFKNSINFFILNLVSATIAFAMYNVQRLSPYMHYIGSKNNTFVLTVSEWLADPLQLVAVNSIKIPYYVAHGLGYLIFVLGIFGMFIYYKKEKLRTLYLLCWLILPYIFMMCFNRVLYTRYIIFYLPLFIIFASHFIATVLDAKKINKYLFIFLLLVFSSFSFYYSYTVVFDWRNIPFVKDDRGQYIEDWPAGYGAKEIMGYLREKSKIKDTYVLAEGNFGMAGDVLDSLLIPGDEKIHIRPYWPLNEKDILDNQKEIPKSYVYIVFSHRTDFPMQWPIKQVLKYEKPGGKSALYLFELLPVATK